MTHPAKFVGVNFEEFWTLTLSSHASSYTSCSYGLSATSQNYFLNKSATNNTFLSEQIDISHQSNEQTVYNPHLANLSKYNILHIFFWFWGNSDRFHHFKILFFFPHLQQM
jgi:hypothetical protein